MYEEFRLAGQERLQRITDEAAQAQLGRQYQPKALVRPRLARGLMALARRIDPATAPARQARSA